MKHTCVNLAVIGYGIWGRNHVRVLSDMKNVNLATISDVSTKTVSNLARKHHVDYNTDPQQVFDDPDVDAVTICTPTVTHYNLTKRAIQAGKHVLVEKPMTDSIQEAEELIQLSETHNVKLAVGFIERFNPAIQKAVELIKQNKIGDVILAHTKRVSRWPIRIGDVGVIKDLAIHDVDIINQLFGVEAGTVFANAGKIRHNFEDYANIIMCFPDHKAAFVETNWLTPRKVRTLTVTGTEGIINVDFITQTITIENDEQIVQPFIGNGEPLRLELESFRDSILNNTPPRITGRDGLRALKVCESALQSARTGKPVVNNPETCDLLIEEVPL